LDKYFQSELADVVHTRGLVKHVPKMTSLSVYPGDIETGLLRRMVGIR
jgi:hypothetical protein